MRSASSWRRSWSATVKGAGGKVVGRIAYPFPETTDFSSLLVQAQASGAKVLALCNAGDDTVNAVKQAQEFGLMNTMKIVPLLLQSTTVHSLGLPVAQGLEFATSYYWDLNDRTRAFQKRIHPKTPNINPNMTQAGDYGVVIHYLKAVAVDGRGRGQGGRAGDGGEDEVDADRRRLLRPRHDPRGRAGAASGVSDAGQDAGREQERVGRAEGGRNDAGRRGLAANERRRLPVHQGLTLPAIPCR